MLTSDTSGRFRRTVCASLIPLFLAAVGCAQVLGIEKRTEEEPQDGVEDVETGYRTTELCVEYCDTVEENCPRNCDADDDDCTTEFAVYLSRESCINTCNALPPGLSSEPLGNSVECRLARATSAGGSPDEFCAQAGPGGGGSCGTNCEAWCHLLESECPADFAVLSDCEAVCQTLPNEGGFDVTASYTSDDIQCRLIHLGAAADDDVHCEHARYLAFDQCVPDEDEVAECSRYCDTVMTNCSGDEAVYESDDDCLAACAALPESGTLGDQNGNTVGCRIYHGMAAAEDPVTHCDHAGPTGDGQCKGAPDDGQTGSCVSYCSVLEAGCPVEFALDFAAVGDCAAACATQLDGEGAEDRSGYTVQSARDEDSLQCRMYYAVKAAAGDVSACDQAVLSGACE